MTATLLYLASLVLVNVAYLTPWTWFTFPVVGAWSAGSILVGAVFVARDYAQRRTGHWVGVAMVVGIAITAAMSRELAVASGCAFAASEGLEWVIFTVTRRPFRERVVISAVPSVVLDSLVFLALAPFPFSMALFLAQVASKLIAVLVFIPATAPRREVVCG